MPESIAEIVPGMYRLEIPLPHNPLKATNCYVILSADRNLVIDTGMNRPECRQAMNEGLRALAVDLSRTDFFLTHMHADHAGLVGELAAQDATVYCSGPDADILQAFLASTARWDDMRRFACRNGFPREDAAQALARHPGNVYSSRRAITYRRVNDGDVVSSGGFSFRCIATPGHTPGHMCLYEPTRRLLIAGDHILSEITPNISLWADDWDPLAAYLASLDKVYNLAVDMLLPGHRRPLPEQRTRIRELKQHHRERLAEILRITQPEPQHAFHIAAQMHWDMTYPTFADFPVWQQWFAVGEALAHLKYLLERGWVQREERGGMLYFATTRQTAALAERLRGQA